MMIPTRIRRGAAAMSVIVTLFFALIAKWGGYLWRNRANAYQRWRARRRYRALGPDEQMVVWAQAIKSSPHLRALWRDAINVKGREEISEPGIRRKIWTPGR